MEGLFIHMDVFLVPILSTASQVWLLVNVSTGYISTKLLLAPYRRTGLFV